MGKSMLVLFWVIWHLDVLIALFGYREFIMGVFGRYAAANSSYILFWTVLMLVMLAIISGSVYLKNHDKATMGLMVAAIPVVLALPYVLWLLSIMIFGGNNWR